MSCGKEVWSGREVWGRKVWRGSEGRDVWRDVGLEGGRWVWRKVWCEKGMKGGRSGIEIRMGITREECIERKLTGVRSGGEKDWVWRGEGLGMEGVGREVWREGLRMKGVSGQ